MKQLYTFLCLIFLLVGAACWPAQAQWASALTGNSSIGTNDAVLDASGNTYLVGECDRTLNLNNNAVAAPYQGTGSSQFYVARFSPQGAVLWAQRGGGGSSSSGNAVAVEANGVVTVAGDFRETMILGGATGVTLTTTSASITEGFVVRYSALGTVLAAWAVRGGGAQYECNDMVVDAGGNSYVTGQATTTTLTGTVRSRFVRKYSNQGQLVWSKDITGPALNNIKLGLLGTQVLATGFFDNQVTFDSKNSLTNGGLYATFYDTQTGVVNSTTLLANAGFPSALQIDATGSSFYLGGIFDRSMVLSGALPLTGSPTGRSGFVARFSAQGAVQWAQAIVGSKGVNSYDGYMDLTSLALDAAGTHVLAGGFFDGAATFSPSKVLTGNVRSFSSFIADYSAQGALRGVRHEIGATASISLKCMTADPTGGVQPFIAGSLISNSQTVATTTTVAGVTLPVRAFYTDGFVARVPAVVLATRLASPAYRFTVYPVPSQGGYLHLELPAATLPEATLTISNVLGQLLRSHTVPARTASTTISTAGLAPGQYLVRLATATESNTQLIEVE